MYGLTSQELLFFRKLDTPRKIQDCVEKIPINHERGGETCLSPRRVLRERRAHCIEAAMLAALAFRIHGQPPLILDLTAAPHDLDHVIAPFKINGCWGAISKSNHAVLRYRDPVYRTIRELVMSYFHEYTDRQGQKTLRSYSRPVNLARYDSLNWMTTEQDLWSIAHDLDRRTHVPILTPSQRRTLRVADPVERRAGKIVQWK